MNTGWIDTARALEAAGARVIASKASIPVNGIEPNANESIRLSADQLKPIRVRLTSRRQGLYGKFPTALL